jgi:hypothetical protein
MSRRAVQASEATTGCRSGQAPGLPWAATRPASTITICPASRSASEPAHSAGGRHDAGRTVTARTPATAAEPLETFSLINGFVANLVRAELGTAADPEAAQSADPLSMLPARRRPPSR